MTEALRIVTCVIRGVRVCAGGVYDLRYHVVWCPNYRGLVVADLTEVHRRELIQAMARGHGWRIMVLGIMPSLMRLFMKAHPSGPPSRVARQFKDFTVRRWRAEFPQPQSRLPALWSRLNVVATIGAALGQAVRRYIGTHNERLRRTERSW